MMKLSDTEKNVLFQTACVAARKAGVYLKESFGRRKEITYKGRIDLVTNVDLKAEAAILSVIRERHPDHDIITEESSPELTGSPFRWIIDPLDGTVNYAHDFPMVAVSVGLEVEGEMQAGVVYNPILEEFFSARRGGGAFLNDNPIRVSDTDDIEKSFLATGFPYNIREDPRDTLGHFVHMMKQAQAVRRIGSAALDLCYTAMGRFDGYYELTIHPWDIAAGMLIVAEAGGMVTDLDGGPLSPMDRQIVSSNGKIHDRLLGELRAARKGD